MTNPPRALRAGEALRRLLLAAGLLAALVAVVARVSSQAAARRVQLVVGMGSLQRLALRTGKSPAQVAAALHAAGVGGLWVPEETPDRLMAQGRLSLLSASGWRDLRRAAGVPLPASVPPSAAYLLVGAHHVRLARFVVAGLKVGLGAPTLISERLVGSVLAIGVDRSAASLGPLPLGFGPAGLALAHQAGMVAVPVVQLPSAAMDAAGVRSLFSTLATAAAPVYTLAVSAAPPGAGPASSSVLRTMTTFLHSSGWVLAMDTSRPGRPAPADGLALRRALGGSVGVYRVPLALRDGNRPDVARIVAAVQERADGLVYLDAAGVGSGTMTATVAWCRGVTAGLRAAGYRLAPPLPLPRRRPGVLLRVLGALAVVAAAWSLVETLWPGRTHPWPWLGAGGMLAVAVAMRPVLADAVAVLAVAAGAGLAPGRLAGQWQVAAASFRHAVAATASAAGWSGGGLLLGMAMAPSARGAWIAVPLALVVGLAATPRLRAGVEAASVGLRGAGATAALLLTAAVGVVLAAGAVPAVVGPLGWFVAMVAVWPLLLGALAAAATRRDAAVAFLPVIAAGQAVWAQGFLGLPPGLALRREGLSLAVGLVAGSLLWVAVRAHPGHGGRQHPRAGSAGRLTG